MDLNKQIANYFDTGKSMGKQSKEATEVRGLFDRDRMSDQERDDAADMLDLYRSGYREWDSFTEDEKRMMVSYSAFLDKRKERDRARDKKNRGDGGFLSDIADAIRGLFQKKGNYGGVSDMIYRRRN